MVIIDYAYLEPDFNSQLDVWNYLASGGTVERLNLMDEADVWQLYENQLATYRFNNIKPEWQFDTEQSFYHYKRFCKAASED